MQGMVQQAFATVGVERLPWLLKTLKPPEEDQPKLNPGLPQRLLSIKLFLPDLLDGSFNLFLTFIHPINQTIFYEKVRPNETGLYSYLECGCA
jgi:hypothetical protein